MVAVDVATAAAAADSSCHGQQLQNGLSVDGGIFRLSVDQQDMAGNDRRKDMAGKDTRKDYLAGMAGAKRYGGKKDIFGSLFHFTMASIRRRRQVIRNTTYRHSPSLIIQQSY